MLKHDPPTLQIPGAHHPGLHIRRADASTPLEFSMSKEWSESYALQQLTDDVTGPDYDPAPGESLCTACHHEWDSHNYDADGVELPDAGKCYECGCARFE